MESLLEQLIEINKKRRDTCRFYNCDDCPMCKEIYGISCEGENQTITLCDVLRKIGKSL